MAPLRRLALAALAAAVIGGCGHTTGPTDAYSDRASIPRPTGLAAFQSQVGAFMNWQAPDSDFVVIRGWHVYRTTPDGATFRLTSDPLVDRSFEDRDPLLPGLTRYAVTALSRGGVESFPSEPAFVFVDTLPPSRPEGIMATVQPNSIFVTWNRGPENDLAGYDVYRNFALAATISDPDQPGYLDFDVVPGKEYTYYVIAVDFQRNESAPSDTVRAMLAGGQSE